MSYIEDTNKAALCNIKDTMTDKNNVKVYIVTNGLIDTGNKWSAFVPFSENHRSFGSQ